MLPSAERAKAAESLHEPRKRTEGDMSEQEVGRLVRACAPLRDELGSHRIAVLYSHVYSQRDGMRRDEPGRRPPRSFENARNHEVPRRLKAILKTVEHLRDRQRSWRFSRSLTAI